MPVDIRLSDDHEYLIYTMSDPVTIEEVMQAYEEELRLRNAIPYTLSAIVDMSELQGVPRSWLTAKGGPGFTHPRGGSILLVGVNRPIISLLHVIFTVVRYTRVQFFDEYAEAEARMRELIVEQRQADGRNIDGSYREKDAPADTV